MAPPLPPEAAGTLEVVSIESRCAATPAGYEIEFTTTGNFPRAIVDASDGPGFMPATDPFDPADNTTRTLFKEEDGLEGGEMSVRLFAVNDDGSSVSIVELNVPYQRCP